MNLESLLQPRIVNSQDKPKPPHPDSTPRPGPGGSSRTSLV